jgi:hypothetical protein
MLKALIPAFAIALVAGSGGAIAQSGGSGELKPPPPLFPGKGAKRGQRAGKGRAGNAAQPADREAVRKKIRAMRTWYLTEELALDDATAAKLFPILAKYDDQLDALHTDGARLRRTLRQGLVRGQGDTGRQVDALLAHYDKVYQLQRERLLAARKVLTPSQSGRLVLVMPRVDNAIRRQIGNVMRGERGGKAANRRRGRGARPTSSDLEDPYAEEAEAAAPRRRAAPRQAEPEFADPF